MRNFKTPPNRQRALYEAGGGTRKLRIVIDELIKASADPADPVIGMLLGLARSPEVELYRFDGSPQLSSPDQLRPPNLREGWVEVVAAAPGSGYSHDVAYRNGNAWGRAAITGDIGRGEIARDEPTYTHLSPPEAAERRNSDAVLLGAADAIDADLVITDREFLLDGHWFASLPTLPCTAADGVPLVAQLLRSRGIYPADVAADRGIALTFNRGLYFFVGARSLLPEGWRWFSHCVEAEDGEPLEDLVVTAQSVFQRLKRTLMARDALRWQLTLQQNNDVAEDILAEVDHILVDLVGAFDAAARVAHRVLGIAGSEYNAGWQKDTWRRRVAQQAPGLARIVSPGSEGADLFEVMRLMRNTVHGAGLQALGLGHGAQGRRVGTAVSLPIGETARLREILEARGWAEAWGLTEFFGGRFYVSPEAFTDHILRAAVPVLNELMHETPVERLLDHPARLPGRPTPNSNDLDPFAYGDSILMQLGFNPADFRT